MIDSFVKLSASFEPVDPKAEVVCFFAACPCISTHVVWKRGFHLLQRLGANDRNNKTDAGSEEYRLHLRTVVWKTLESAETDCSCVPKALNRWVRGVQCASVVPTYVVLRILQFTEYAIRFW